MRATVRHLLRRSSLVQILAGVRSSPALSPTVSVPTLPFIASEHINRLPFYPSRRAFCSASSNIVPIRSEHDFNAALAKVKGGSFPAIFYFTAVWCGPCRFIAPVIGELSEKYPHVTTYKVDIDQEGLEKTLRDMKVGAVPTLQFFRDGIKEVEIVGADVTGFKDTMEKLYSGKDEVSSFHSKASIRKGRTLLPKERDDFSEQLPDEFFPGECSQQLNTSFGEPDDEDSLRLTCIASKESVYSNGNNNTNACQYFKPLTYFVEFPRHFF